MASSKMIVAYDSLGKRLSIGAELGSGGEGAVFDVGEKTGELIAKLYHKEVTPERKTKLTSMVQLKNEHLLKFAAWPIDLIYADGNKTKVTGILMPKASGFKEIHELYSPKTRLQEFPSANWSFLIHTASNLARAFHAVHFYGQVVGDVNPSNILVSSQALVKLIDCDSFQISFNDKRFLCDVGVSTHQPPEMTQHTSFRGITRTYNHDNFGLAVLIFQLLFMGRHPFSGQYLGTGEMPIEKAIKESRFAYSRQAAKTQMKQPPGTLMLNAISAPVAALFEKAFIGEASTSLRPTAKEWVDALTILSKNLKQCTSNKGHQYLASLVTCPWCEIESKSGIILFTSLIAATGAGTQLFQLELIWNSISQVKSPGLAPDLPDYRLLKVQPSEKANSCASSKRVNKIAAIALAITAIVLVIKFTVSGWKLFFAAVATLYGTLALYNSGGSQTFREIEQNYRDANQRYSALVTRWKSEAGDAEFNQKANELLKAKKEYLELNSLRQRKLQQLNSDLRQRQLEKFLDTHRIDKATISNIGPGRKASLQSFGIETALDITTRAIRGIPGFGPYLTSNLLDWRRAVEGRFVFDPKKGVDPADIAKVNAEIQNLKLKLERILTNGPNDLRNCVRNVGQRRALLKPEIEKYQMALAQAEADMNVVKSLFG